MRTGLSKMHGLFHAFLYHGERRKGHMQKYLFRMPLLELTSNVTGFGYLS